MLLFSVILFPGILLAFALAMENVESRLSRLTVRQEDVEEFLDQADQAEVAALAQHGLPAALARFRRRRRRTATRPAEVVSRS